MKAERRHDLKTNALARGIEGVPNYWREYGSRLLLVVLVAAIVFLLVRYWNDKKARDAQLVTDSMQTSRTGLRELEALPIQITRNTPSSMIAEEREKLSQQIEQAITAIQNTTKDKQLLSSSYLMRGDLDWALANFPALPGAATQPTLDVPNKDGLLQQAQASYEKVLDGTLSPTIDDTFYARIGLAAIAENQRQWDKAQQQYQAIANATNMTAGYKGYANDRLEQLPELQSSVLLVPAPPVAPTPPPTTSPAQRGPIGPMPLQSIFTPSTEPSRSGTPATGLTKTGTGSLNLRTSQPATSRPATTEP